MLLPRSLPQTVSCSNGEMVVLVPQIIPFREAQRSQRSALPLCQWRLRLASRIRICRLLWAFSSSSGALGYTTRPEFGATVDMNMVQRLNTAQTRQIIRDLVPQGLCEYAIPEPVSPARVEEFCSGIAAQAAGRCYGWFDANLVPRGLLVGMIVPDPMTGLLHGLEHAWWSAWKGKPALEFLRVFET